VIVIASDDQPQARARVLSGAAAYLHTPVDKHALLNAATAVASDALESAWSWQG